MFFFTKYRLTIGQVIPNRTAQMAMLFQVSPVSTISSETILKTNIKTDVISTSVRIRICSLILFLSIFFQFFNSSIFQFFNFSILQFFNFSILQFFNSSILQFFKVITSQSVNLLPSMVNLTKFLSLCHPWMPAAPGLMWRRRSVLSYCTFRMCEWPAMKSCGGEA